MTRKKEEATAGLRRGRTLATAGLGAATLIGGLVYAAPAANAATAPTVTVTAPTNLDNSAGGSGSALGLKVVNNTGASLTGLNYVLTIGVPAGVTCSNVSFTSAAGADGDATPVLTDGASTNDCQFVGTTPVAPSTGYSLANGATADASGTLQVTPSPAATGTVTETFAVYQTDATGTHQIASASGSSQLVAPHAPAFNSGAVPSANVYVPFNYDLVSDAGFPVTDPATGYVAKGYYKNSSGVLTALTDRSPVAANVAGSGTPATVNHYIDLRDVASDGTTPTGPQFYFDTDTGNIVTGTIAGAAPAVFTAGSASTVYTAPNATWTIVADNGTAVRAATTTAAPPVPSLTATQVGSPQFQLSVDFKDVAADSPFKADIDALAGQTDPVSLEAVIQGFADGTFGVAKPVSRGQFAAFVVRELNASGIAAPGGGTWGEGACATGASGFPDVPDSTQFCKEINELAAAGVINGYTDGTFRPATVLSRQVVAGMFFRTNDVVQGSAVGDAAQVDTKFADVKSDNVFSGDINWAVNAGPTTIINGYGDGTFRPTGVATRQVTAAYLARFAQDFLNQFSGVTGL